MNTYNEYEFSVSDDVPSRPDKLFTPEQLAEALEAAYDVATVEVSTRFTRTIARVECRGSDADVWVSWQHFREEQIMRDAGWTVVCSAIEADPHISRQ